MAQAVALRPSMMPAPSATRPQSILSRKRSNRDSDNDEDQVPAKRLKVSFDTDVDVRAMDKPGEKDIAVIKEEVRRAISQRETGESEDYDEIKNYFDAKPGSSEAPTSTLLRKYLYALIHNANLLKGKFVDLVNAVLKTQWLAHDEAFASTYIKFLGQLGSSHSSYIPNILKMLVMNLSHLSTSAGRAAKSSPSDRAKLISRVHLAIKYLIQLIPSSSGQLLLVLPKCYPFSDDTRKAHLDYAKNLLRIIDYAPELKADILDLLTERLIKIDVEVQIDVDELEEDVGDLLVDETTRRAAFDSSDDEDELSDEESEDDEDEDDIQTAAEANEARLKNLRASVEKMDSMLDLLFNYYDPMFAGKQGSSSAIFDLLLSQFSKTVLPTYRSRHTQFLLFHFAQTSPELTTRFLSTCLNIIMDKTRTSVLRMSAADYLASFIARGVHVTGDDVFYVFNSLSQWVNTQRVECEPRCKGPNVKAFGPYYSAFQALIYIFCFRWRDLLADPEEFEDDEDILNGLTELKWTPGIRDTFNINAQCSLNPLKVCAPEIVEEFARIARHLNLVYVFNILDQNKRIRLSQFVKTYTSMGRETALSGLHAERFHQLDAYFPFDPYRLPVSRKWIEADYNEWRGVPGLHDITPVVVEDVDSSVEDDEDEDDDEEEDRTGTESPMGSR